MNVYPNPNSGKFTIELLHFDSEVEVLVFNAMGTVIQRIIANDDKTNMNLTNSQRGIYFIKAMDGKKHITKKIIVQ
jgi:hypothetical protein